MKELCWSQAKPLNDLLEYRIAVEKCTKTDPVMWLDRLAAIFRATNPMLEDNNSHPCKEAIEEVSKIINVSFY